MQRADDASVALVNTVKRSVVASKDWKPKRKEGEAVGPKEKEKEKESSR